MPLKVGALNDQTLREKERLHPNAEALFARFKGAERGDGRSISSDAPAEIEGTKEAAK